MVFGREIIEVATFRANQVEEEGVEVHEVEAVVRDNIFGTIEEDAVRRDFTANALYYSIEDFSIRDYVGGFEDVQARVLRLIGDPERRYREDPVRMLRAVRLAAKLGFTVDDPTAEPIPRLAPLLRDAAPARLFEETLKLFLSGHGVQSFPRPRTTRPAGRPVPGVRLRVAVQPQRRAATDGAQGPCGDRCPRRGR